MHISAHAELIAFPPLFQKISQLTHYHCMDITIIYWVLTENFKHRGSRALLIAPVYVWLAASSTLEFILVLIIPSWDLINQLMLI